MKYLGVFCVFFASINTVAQPETHSPRAAEARAERNVPKTSTVIPFGGDSVSGKFKSAGAIYREKDGYRIIYDGNDGRLLGSPFVSDIEIDTTGVCDGFKGKVYKSHLENLNLDDAPTAQKSSKALPVEYPAGKCPGKKIKLRLMAPRCISPDPACKKLVVRETFEISGDDLFWLDQFKPSKPDEVPNRAE